MVAATSYFIYYHSQEISPTNDNVNELRLINYMQNLGVSSHHESQHTYTLYANILLPYYCVPDLRS